MASLQKRIAAVFFFFDETKLKIPLQRQERLKKREKKSLQERRVTTKGFRVSLLTKLLTVAS